MALGQTKLKKATFGSDNQLLLVETKNLFTATSFNSTKQCLGLMITNTLIIQSGNWYVDKVGLQTDNQITTAALRAITQPAFNEL